MPLILWATTGAPSFSLLFSPFCSLMKAVDCQPSSSCRHHYHLNRSSTKTRQRCHWSRSQMRASWRRPGRSSTRAFSVSSMMLLAILGLLRNGWLSIMNEVPLLHPRSSFPAPTSPASSAPSPHGCASVAFSVPPLPCVGLAFYAPQGPALPLPPFTSLGRLAHP